MEFMRAIKHMTPDECREVGEILLSLADSPRDAAWHANIDQVIARFRHPDSDDWAKQLEEGSRAVEQLWAGIKADGMDHRTLIEAELQRRGDRRSFEHYRDEMGGVHSDLTHEWRP